MSAFQRVNELSQRCQQTLMALLQDDQQSTLWIGNSAETAITDCVPKIQKFATEQPSFDG